jgi:hypothetical protein
MRLKVGPPAKTAQSVMEGEYAERSGTMVDEPLRSEETGQKLLHQGDITMMCDDHDGDRC